MRFGLIGEKLGHSFSKEIHEKLGRYPYELIEVPPEGLDAFMKARDFDGINVTIPYKQAVIPYLDEISPRAAAIGAVNTVVNRSGRLWGDNTDFGGMEALIRRMGLEVRGKDVLIAGTGGTSRTAAAVAQALGASEITRMSRSGRDGALTYASAYRKHGSAAILIHTTPAGMYPDVNGCAVDLDRLPQLEGVVDVVYNPLTTRLVLDARTRGIPAENGLFMLTAQAVLAAEDFTGGELGEDVTEKIYRELCFEKRSIVLTGMPGSGKSTLGALLARRLGRTFVDTDAEIVKRAGIQIKEIFRKHGESRFRDLESEVIRELSRHGGAVIATGGGAVLRRENVDALKQNAVLVFLDRPLESLQPTDDRPLADDPSKLHALYLERRPIYLETADLTVAVTGTPEDTMNTILEKIQ